MGGGSSLRPGGLGVWDPQGPCAFVGWVVGCTSPLTHATNRSDRTVAGMKFLGLRAWELPSPGSGWGGYWSSLV